MSTRLPTIVLHNENIFWQLIWWHFKSRRRVYVFSLCFTLAIKTLTFIAIAGQRASELSGLYGKQPFQAFLAKPSTTAHTRLNIDISVDTCFIVGVGAASKRISVNNGKFYSEFNDKVVEFVATEQGLSPFGREGARVWTGNNDIRELYLY
jgi:hypothetical protein